MLSLADPVTLLPCLAANDRNDSNEGTSDTNDTSDAKERAIRGDRYYRGERGIAERSDTLQAIATDVDRYGLLGSARVILQEGFNEFTLSRRYISLLPDVLSKRYTIPSSG